MDLDAFRALLTPEGQILLKRARQVYDAEGGDALRTVTVLRRDAAPEAAAVALTQVELRRRAAAKLGSDLADRMYFTPDGLEQATRRRVAEHRAARVVDGPAGVRARPRLRHRRRPGHLRPRRADRRRRRPRPAPRRGGPGQPGRARPRRRRPGRGGRGARRLRLRRGLRRPGAAYLLRPGVRRRRLVAAVVVRRAAADPALLREGGAGHPARPGAARRRGGVRQRRRARSRRPRCGRPRWRPRAAGRR